MPLPYESIHTGAEVDEAVSAYLAGTGSGIFLMGVVDPEGAVTAEPGRMYANKATKSLWLKETGSSNTGWVQYL